MMRAGWPAMCASRRGNWLQVIVTAVGAFLLQAVICQAAPNHAHEQAAQASSFHFEVTFPASQSATPLDGRIYVIVSKSTSGEPRMEMSDQPSTQQMFGVDVDGMAPGKSVIVNQTALGFPLDNVSQIPAGDYTVQALLNIYETFHRADGHVVKLPMDHGEGQQWNRKPGNLYSKPQRVHIDPASGGVVQIEMTEKIPPIEPPPDTKWVKHLTIQSDLLTKFWGRPMNLTAIVLLPEGFDEHPDSHYPLMLEQGHFPRDYTLRTEPPSPDLQGMARTRAEAQYRFFQDWVAGRLPRMLFVEVQHANPYYDDSYSVNSANVGPYGDAIMHELLPAVERKYRGIGQGWARAVEGGSTGGWEALATQIFYPSEFNGSWGLCPDPVDFRGYQIVNIYDDQNALWIEGPFSKVPRPAVRRPDGNVVTTMDREIRREEVLGTHGRSADQFGIWQAVFSPLGEDGYPKPIWDPMTGVIDHKVAEYWRDHYDLRYILDRDWKTLGPQLVGKLHIKVGTRDTYYLDIGVRFMDEFLKSTNNPHAFADVEYGPHLPHCYTGHPELPNALGSLDLQQRILPAAVDWMLKTAPKGADISSWKY